MAAASVASGQTEAAIGGHASAYGADKGKGYGAGSGYGSSGYGSSYGSSYGSGYDSGYGYGSDYDSGYGSDYGSGYGSTLSAVPTGMLALATDVVRERVLSSRTTTVKAPLFAAAACLGWLAFALVDVLLPSIYDAADAVVLQSAIALNKMSSRTSAFGSSRTLMTHFACALWGSCFVRLGL